MDETRIGNGQAHDEDPNFVFGGNYVVSEDRWLELAAQGVSNVVESIPRDDVDKLRAALDEEGRRYGPKNLLLGHAYDAEASRALKHKAGVGIYVTPEGRAQYERSRAREKHQPPMLNLPGVGKIEARPGRRINLRRKQSEEAPDD